MVYVVIMIFECSTEKKTRLAAVIVENNEIDVLIVIGVNPRVSTREIARISI